MSASHSRSHRLTSDRHSYNSTWPCDMILLAVILLWSSSVLAIFEDQAGKFDWRKQLIGCPKNVVIDWKDGKPDSIIVSTEQSILASLRFQTGNIEWRRVLETPIHDENKMVSTADENFVYTASEDGRIVRVWRKLDGSLVRQLSISDKESKHVAIGVSDRNIYVSSARKIMKFAPEDDQSPSSVIASESALEFSSFFHFGTSKAFAWITENSERLTISPIDVSGSFEKPHDLKFVKFSQERCLTHNQYLSCFNGNVLSVADVLRSQVIESTLNLKIKAIYAAGSKIIAVGETELQVIEIAEGGLNVMKSLNKDPTEIVGLSENSKLVALVSQKSVRVVSTESEKNDILTISRTFDENNSGPRSVFLNSADVEATEHEILILGIDCRIELITVNVRDKNIVTEWYKEESLINAVSVEMVDLPLSESQQLIEDEFEDSDHNIGSAFIRRIHVQFGQVCRLISKIVERAFFVFSAFSESSNGLSEFISSVRFVSHSGSAGPFERDYFNLRKVVLITTTNGVIFGIDSNNGHILWKIWLGDDFVPLSSGQNKNRVPLFVQRTTAHYQLNGVATTSYTSKSSSNGIVLSFNPMNGKIETVRKLAHPIKRISMLPIVNHKHVSPILAIDGSNEVHIFPAVTEEELTPCSTLHILDLSEDQNSVRGLLVDLVNRKLHTIWTGNMGFGPNEEIVAMKGKSYNQKVHSQGRVLVTRDVQYKYVNPNLASIVSLNKITQQMTIVLLDIVTGQIVHSSSISKASKPIHMVHTENWIAYSYWSEKGRRTELGVLELYESTVEQSQKHVFDSKLLNQHPPTVLMQSYIYAQGVDVMSLSETEKSLTTRSILLAHPSGNIHEVSKRLLDATRPLELTQAMREEMMIGYMPEIAIASEEMINYNQTVNRVRGIKTSPSGLESTSLLLAYGTDLFFTRLVPSGTFDILKDDFDHVLISLVLSGLIIGSYASKRLARSNALAAQWA